MTRAIPVSKETSGSSSPNLAPVEAVEEIADDSHVLTAADTEQQPKDLGFYRGLALHLGQLVGSILKAVCWCIIWSLRYLWRHPSHAVCTAALITILGLVVAASSQMHDRLILTEISNGAVDQIIEASRFTRSYSAPQVGQSGVYEFLKVGAPTWAQRESVRAVLYNARRAGLPTMDQAVLLATVEIESGFNPMARAPTSSACGLFQFVKATGRNFGLDPENCMNPWANSLAGVQHYLYNYERRVAPHLAELNGAERLFRAFELSYYMHHDGPGYSKPAPELKATVLGGVAFLFRVHEVLEKEQRLKSKAPTFAATFGERMWKLARTRIDDMLVHTAMAGEPDVDPFAAQEEQD